jgi:phage regulator Rha-like protein
LKFGFLSQNISMKFKLNFIKIFREIHGSQDSQLHLKETWSQKLTTTNLKKGQKRSNKDQETSDADQVDVVVLSSTTRAEAS